MIDGSALTGMGGSHSPAPRPPQTPVEADRYPLGLCLSGGGYRAMLFHAGALARLNDANLLSKIYMISSVSAGSIASGLLAYVWPKLIFEDGFAVNFKTEYLDKIVQFSQVFADAPSIVKGVLNPFSSAAREAVKVLEAKLLEGSHPTLKSLPVHPWFVFCASNLSTGSLFRMSNRYIADYRIGMSSKADLPLAVAIAASAAFPPVLSPLPLDLSQFEWEDEKVDLSIGDPVPPGRAVLTDGGVYDNHGIEPALKRCDCVLVSDAGAPWQYSGKSFWNYVSQLKRVLDTSDNQVRSLRRRSLLNTFNAGKVGEELGLSPDIRSSLNARTRGVYWSINGKPQELAKSASMPPPFSTINPSEIGTYLHFLGAQETEHLINWGYFVCDARMQQFFAHSIPPAHCLPVPSGSLRPSKLAKLSNAMFRLLPG